MGNNHFYVYCHRRKIDNKCFYIGKGKNNRYKSKQGRNQHWWNIVNKYDFETEILINNISEEKAFELEAIICEKIGYENLCNIRKETGWGGWSQADETKYKIGKSNLGHIHNNETIEKIRLSKIGKQYALGKKWKWKTPKSLDTKSQISKSLTGKPKSEQHKQNLRKPKSEQHQQNISKSRYKNNVGQFDRNNNLIKVWANPTITKKELNIKGIYENLHNRAKSAGGYIWKYI